MEEKASAPPDAAGLSQLIEPLILEIRSMKKSMEDALATHKEEITTDITNLKDAITEQKNEIVCEISKKVEVNSKNISRILEENKVLKRKNNELKDQIGKIETSQLSNNTIITGIPEQPFEAYDKTKKQIHETIAQALVAIVRCSLISKG